MTRKVMMNSFRRLWMQCAPGERNSNSPKRVEHQRLCCGRLPWKSATAQAGWNDRACECRWRNENGRRPQQTDTSRGMKTDASLEAEHLSGTSRGPAAQGGQDLPVQDCQGQSVLIQTIFCHGEFKSQCLVKVVLSLLLCF